MTELLECLTKEVSDAFTSCGFDATHAKVTLSNRPDLCEFQCNGAMPLAKTLHRAPIEIAKEVAEVLAKSDTFSSVEAVNPGFLNMKITSGKLVSFVKDMAKDPEHFGVAPADPKETIIMDYGGPNVAKPLHVGHLRSAVIGEAMKRLARFMGQEVISDVHLGDWGLQMGLIITELSKRKPELCYFDPDYTGEYPSEPPFTISELEEIYPTASGKSKEDENYRNEALLATKELQKGRGGYQALLRHIMNVSVNDLKRNYKRLDVDFDLWKGESDADPYIGPMVERLKKEGYAHESEGALVVDVAEETDTKTIPPCMILKSDGAALYDTTDLATLIWRREDYDPDEVLYVVDKRQELHFIQVFRAAKKTGIVKDDTKLTFLGFGTVNGPDGKALKTRDGGVMRLEFLLDDIKATMLEKIKENDTMTAEEAEETAEIVSLAAVKYGDLSNQPGKDYIFDLKKFTSFEGNTGPYVLYTIVRVKSILRKFEEQGGVVSFDKLLPPEEGSQKELMLLLPKFIPSVRSAYETLSPNVLCAYVYELSNALNHFYHETKILKEEDEEKKASYVALLALTKDILEKSISLLGFKAPEKM